MKNNTTKSEEQETWWKIQTGQKRENVHKKAQKTLKEALGSLLRRRYNIYSLSPGMLRSVYCPPIPQCWCLIFKTSILPRDLRHQPRNTLQVQNPWASPVRAEGRRSRSASFLPLPRAHEGGLFHFSCFLRILTHFLYYCSTGARERREEKKREKKNTGYFGESTMSATFPGLVHDAEVGSFISLYLAF